MLELKTKIKNYAPVRNTPRTRKQTGSFTFAPTAAQLNVPLQFDTVELELDDVYHVELEMRIVPNAKSFSGSTMIDVEGITADGESMGKHFSIFSGTEEESEARTVKLIGKVSKSKSFTVVVNCDAVCNVGLTDYTATFMDISDSIGRGTFNSYVELV